MLLPRYFTKLMKSETHRKPLARIKKSHQRWIVDESKFLGASEIKRLRAFVAKQQQTGYTAYRFHLIRHWFIIELGLFTGLRVSEMSNLKLRDFLVEENQSSLIVVGKGDKKRIIWLSESFKKTYLKYLKYKREFALPLDKNSHVLCSEFGFGITKRTLQYDFKNLLKLSGLSDHYSIHCLRHTYATHLLEASNHNYRFVQSQLGHSSIRTTQVYAGIIEKKGRVALEKLYMKKR